MTETCGNDETGAENGRPSTLPFDPRDLMSMRVSPAAFSRMCKVSRQTVSAWIKRGTITLGIDGKLDPVTASRQVLQNTDPARLRARVFKNATSSHADLRKQLDGLSDKLGQAHALARTAAYRFQDDEAKRLADFCQAIEVRFSDLAAAHKAGLLTEALDALADTAFYGSDSSPDLE